MDGAHFTNLNKARSLTDSRARGLFAGRMRTARSRTAPRWCTSTIRTIPPHAKKQRAPEGALTASLRETGS